MRRCIQCMTPLKEIIHVYNIFKPPTPFCERCEQLWNNIRITHLDERCSRCLNIKTSDSNDCLDCQFLEKEFKLMDQLYCQYRYQGVMKDVLQQYKFMRDYELSNVLSQNCNYLKQIMIILFRFHRHFNVMLNGHLIL